MEVGKGREKERGKEQRDERSTRSVGQSRLPEILKKGLLWHITLFLYAPKFFA